MSKAFTREDEGAADVVVRSIDVSGPRRPITPEGYAQLEADAAELESRRAALKAQGGTDAVAALRDVETRLRQVRALIEHLEPTPMPADAHGRAVFAAWVEVEDEDGARTTYRLVGPDEADAKAGRISVQSPLGRALLGKREGDTFTFERPRGETELTVTAVRSRPT